MVYLVSLAGLGVIESLHPVTVGLNVHLLKAGAVPVSRDFGTEPVVLRLKASSREYTEPPGLYLRSKHVSWSGLEGALQDDLKSRSDRVVYLEGDPEMAYNYAVKAIDIIRRAQGEVVMLTPDRRGNETRPEALHRKGR
jgi:biopolymer transport protein ExbD